MSGRQQKQNIISFIDLEITLDNPVEGRSRDLDYVMHKLSFLCERMHKIVVLVRTHAQDYRSCANACTRFKRSRASVFSSNKMLEV